MQHKGDGVAKCQMMSSCQKDVKCQKIKYLDCGRGSQKLIDIVRFTHIDINFDITYDGNKNPQNVHRKNL